MPHQTPQIQPVLLERRELKYLVPRRLIPALRRSVAAACAPDPHAGPDGRYAIRSLYLDTADLRLFLANEAETPERSIDHALRTWNREPVTVVELKFAGPPPGWMVGLVQATELTRCSFSKYCYALVGALEAAAGIRDITLHMQEPTLEL